MFTPPVPPGPQRRRLQPPVDLPAFDGGLRRRRTGVGCDDRILAIVPMFHANAWGLVYAALMAGADLLMPDRFLQAEPLVRLIDAQKPTVAGAVPTIWNDVLNFVEANPSYDISLSAWLPAVAPPCPFT